MISEGNPSPEICQFLFPPSERLLSRLDVALGSPDWWLVTLHIAGGWRLDDLLGPFQPRPFYESLILRFATHRWKSGQLPSPLAESSSAVTTVASTFPSGAVRASSTGELPLQLQLLPVSFRGVSKSLLLMEVGLQPLEHLSCSRGKEVGMQCQLGRCSHFTSRQRIHMLPPPPPHLQSPGLGWRTRSPHARTGKPLQWRLVLPCTPAFPRRSFCPRLLYLLLVHGPRAVCFIPQGRRFPELLQRSLRVLCCRECSAGLGRSRWFLLSCFLCPVGAPCTRREHAGRRLLCHILLP